MAPVKPGLPPAMGVRSGQRLARWIVTLIVSVPLVYWLVSAGLTPVEHVNTHVLVPALEGGELRPAGEVIAGFEIIQPVILSPAEARRSRELAASVERVCVRLMLDWVSNRHNVGSVRIALSQPGLELERILSASSVGPASLHELCFPPTAFEGFSQSGLVLTIAGVNGSPGTSITALLTPDLDRGAALVNGVDSGAGLVFALTLEQPAPYVSKAVLALTLLFSAQLCLLVYLAAGAWMASET